MNSRRSTPIHITVNISKGKDKERIPKEAREKLSIVYNEASIRITTNFYSKAMEAKRQWKDNQSAERKRLSMEKSISSKTMLHRD